MSEEHDAWFKDAFGVDLGAAVGKIKDVAGAVINEAKGVEAQVEGAVQGVINQVTGAAAGLVKKAAGAAAPSGSAKPSSGGAAGGGTGSFPLGGSVGRGGKNAPSDVRAVQSALGIAADGQCGPQTIGAIEAYQRTLGQAKPDGRVDAGGATERALSKGGKPAGVTPTPAVVPDGDETGGLFDQLKKGAAGLLKEADDLGGKVIDGASKALGGPLGGDQPGSGGGLLGGLSGALGDPGNLLSDVSAPASPLEIELSLGEQEIPAGGKVKVTIELKATGSAKVTGLGGIGLSVSKDGLAAEVATKIWSSDAKLKVAGIDLFADPKFELKGKADKKGATYKVSFSTETPIGKLGFSFTLLEVKLENIKSPTFGSAGGSLEGVPTKYPDQEIRGHKFTEVQITFSGELKVAVDLVKILAQRAAERALQQGAATLGADVIIAGSFIVGGLATIVGATYQIAFGLKLKDLTESYAGNLRALEAGFRAGMSDGPAPGDAYGKKGHELGQQNFKKLIERTRQQNPEASDDQIRAAVISKADDATREAINSGQVEASLKNGMWDGLLADGKWLFTAKDAATAFQACGLGNDPRFDAKAAASKQWQAYLKQYPVQSQL